MTPPPAGSSARSSAKSWSGLWLLLLSRWKIAYRHAKELAFELLVLGPLIVGTLAWISKRYLSTLAPVIERWAALEHQPVSAVVIGLVGVVVLIAGSQRELYDHEALDTLPVSEISRLTVTLCHAAARGAIAGLVASTLLAMVGRAWPPPELMVWLIAIGTSLALLSLLTAVAWVRQPRLRFLWLCLAGLAAAPAGSQVQDVAGRVLGERADLAWEGWLGVSVVALVVLVAYHVTWRRRDLERASASRPAAVRRWLPRLIPPGIPTPWRQAWLSPKFASPALLALVRRDVQLIGRRFSAAVTLTRGASLLALVAMALIAFDERWSPHLVQQAMVLAGVTAVLTTVAVVPYLLRAQLPMFWIEKSLGAPRDDLWRAKAAVALTVTLPTLVAALLLMLTLAPGSPRGVWIAALQLAAGAVMVASIIGLASYEIAATPFLGLLFTALIGIALTGLLVFYSTLWWLWIVGYVFLVRTLIDRAPRRIYFTEVMS